MSADLTATDTLHSSCKVCGTSAYLLCKNHNEHGNIKTIYSYRCTGCGLVFVGNEITSDDLGHAYSTLDTEEYYEETGSTAKNKFTASLQNFEKLGIKKNSAILDIGTGNGDFLLLAQERGYTNLFGHEIPVQPTPRLDSAGITVYRDFDYKVLPPSTFDVVTLMDVMEHVLDPKQVMIEVWRILKPGGIVYFHTPCVTPIDRFMHWLQRVPLAARIGTGWQRSRTSIFHLQNYSRRSIEMILENAGFPSFNLIVLNELSWPVNRYVRVYICEKMGIPTALAPLIVPVIYPFVATSIFNPNKGIVWAQKPVSR